ncbi:non-ribosomal peptide synthetase [Tychonema sp. LEGE 06208]|uniref:amino acid adenylation domain-containing protein n=1 Tax=Tychonema sp. LEGE 06208 TaxID=1828663 RepID=UPI001D143FD3|nr:non-ribosomal peptide synthetase [Tychonema sp. LEGE 06208]
MKTTVDLQPKLTAVDFDPFAGGELFACVPATESQKEIWIAVQMEDEANCAYNESMCLRLQGNLDVESLRFSIQELVQRHESLRTTFSPDGSTLCIASAIEIDIPLIDLSIFDDRDRESKLAHLRRQEVEQPFNLVRGPLFRSQIIKLQEQEYIVILTGHHIICDGWSWGILFPDLGEIYSAKNQGLAVNLPQPESFIEYAILQEEQATSPEVIAAEKYWLNQFSGTIPVLDLPTDRARPPLRTYKGSREDWELKPDLVANLKRQGKKAGCSFFTILLAGFEAFIYRLCGQEDLVVGMPAAGQLVGGKDKLAGHCVSFLPLRTQINGEQSFIDYLRSRRTGVLDAIERQQLTFGTLVKKLAMPRDFSRIPLVPVSFNLDVQLTEDQLNFEGFKAEVFSNPRTYENFEWAVNASETKNKLVLECQYNTNLFDAATIRRRMAEFEVLLEGIVANPNQKISELPLLTEAEGYQLLAEWNNTTKEYPSDKCIHQLFEEQVTRSPDAIAVVFEDKQLTYLQLNQRANKIAHHLRTLGVGPEVSVGICVERSLEMVVGLLGILKAGGPYVPLDPEYPTERLSFMLQNAQVKVLLTQQRLVEKLPEYEAQFVYLDTDWQVISRSSEENPITGVQATNLAYVIYTSGSTGQPKGVAMNHFSLCNLILWQLQNTTISSGAKTLQFAPISFDVSFQEMFSTWCSGGTLLLIAEELRRDAFALLGLLQEKAVERLFVPFVALQQIAEVATGSELVTSYLREIITAGEQLQITPAISSWLSKLTDCTLHNHYGPSESHVVTTFTLTNSADNWPILPPIGRPIANTQIYILDRLLKPVPIGVSGELHIGGAGVARGYLNRPDLTDEKFIPNPFTTQSGSRLYKTGDKARYLSDGNIEFLGRIDNQVKIRGFRIELGEIEAAIAQYPGVRETVVIVREDVPGQKYLAVYIVANNSSTIATSNLRGFLKEKLPDYMIPGALVMLNALPLTPSGKVDRRALPAPEFRPELQRSLVAPRTPIEEMLASIWADVLRIEIVGVHHNFFELGGHSLLATQVISRVRDTFAVELALRSLFEAPTIAEFASRVENSLSNGQSQEAEPLLPIPRSESIPLSFAQQRLWFLDQLQPNSPFYNIPVALRLFGQLNITALQNSINEIIGRHEALRTNFATVEGEPIQVIASTHSWELQVVSLLHLGESEREIEAQRWVNEEANRPFNLERELLLRGLVLQLGETEYVLLLTMHHIISDGWSVGVFLRELAELYKANSTGMAPVLPELSVQYADFALWQRQWLQGEILETQLDYWKQQLLDAPALLELPTDRARPPVQTFRGGYYYAALSLELSAELTALGKRAGVTLFMTLLAAFQTLLCRYTNSEDIVVGTPVAGRNRREIEGLIGFFVNTLVLRTDLGDHPSFEELLARVREVALQAYAHQDLPFEQLVEALQPTRDLSYTPLFQVMFVLDDALVNSVELPELSVSSYSVEFGTSKFDLTLSIENTASGLIGAWEYNTDLFDGSTIARMAGHFQTLLEVIAANPKQKISELPLLTEIEQQQLLIEWNNTHTNYPESACIHQLFEVQAEQTPDAVALVFGEQQLTYQQLNCRANQLAHYLQTLGAGPEVLIGVCFDRSMDAIVSLLAVLKAGSAYLPLDPAYPKERLEFMLSDAALSVLLTQQHLTEKLPDTEAKIVCLEQVREEINAQSEDNLAHLAQAENLAYVMYTSGSTGKPKGVCVVHRGVVRLVKNTDYASFSAAEVFLQLAPISFDASTLEIWGALLNGAQLVVFPPGTPSLAELGEAIRLYNVTILWLTAGLFHLMVDDRIEDLKGVRQLLAGGDVLSVPHVQKLLREAPNCQLINGYGPTENTTFTCCAAIAPDSQISNSVPIGRPIANTQVYILDRHLQPVPIGVPGELYAGGAGLARGYLNRPDLTAEKFIPNPLIANQEDRWKNAEGRSVSSLLPSANHLYKTGDLARYLPDGNIEYLGRIDNQVKIRGFRIEIGEIEAVLAGHLDVSQVSVAVQLDASGNKCLAAYVVPGPGKILAANTLRSFLQKRLPDYMIPAGFVFLDALPLNPNGKVDRRALASQKWQSARVAPDQTIAVAPRDKLELQVKQIWEQVLGINSIGIRDNFFEIGGHSLLAARLLAEIEKIFGKKLPLSTIFQSPTVEQLADILREPEWSSPSPSMVVIQPGTGSYKPPLFCIHVLGRGLEFYRPLLNHLEQSQAILGLSTQIMDEKLAPPNRVEELAAYYIKEMQVFQPHGPYFLLGVSFGGTVAFEIARQLDAKGEKVALLGLLDTYGPDAFKKSSEKKRGQRAMKVLHMTPGVFLGKTQSNLAGKVESITNQIWRISSKFYQAIGRPLPIELENFTHRELNEEALRHYVAGVYSGGATIFKAVESAILFDADPALGWGEVVTGGIEIHEIPSDHLGMLQEPHVRILAEKLQAAVDRARQMNCQ